jgi:hypothetical protein
LEYTSTGIFSGQSQELDFTLSSLKTHSELDRYTLPSPSGPYKRYINLVIWSRPRVNTLHCQCLSFHFLLPASSSFTSFLPETSSCIFGSSLPLEVSIRKLKLSISIAVVLQASQTAVVFYQLSSSTVSCTSGLLRLHLSSFIVLSSIVTVLPDFSGFNCLLPYFQVQFTSGLLRLQLFSTLFFQVQRLFFRSYYYLIIDI